MDKGRIKMRSDVTVMKKGLSLTTLEAVPVFLNFSKNCTLNIEMKHKIC